MHRTNWGLKLVVAGLAFAATPAMAQDATSGEKVDAGQNVAKADDAEKEPSGPFTLDIGLAGVSDYRFRGVSLSDKDPAFQPSITLSHESGFYAGVWGSNIADNDGDDVEVDLLFGFAKTVGTFDVDINATYYAYPGVKDINYWEFIGTASHAVGPATIGAIFAYTPTQGVAVTTRGIYYGVNGELPIGGTPLTLTASFGIEDNQYYNNKRDWSLGVSADVAGFSVGAAYVDTSHTDGDPLGKAGAVVSVSRTFSFSF